MFIIKSGKRKFGLHNRTRRKVTGIERGSIRATVLIETLPSVFQMNEIFYKLRDHLDSIAVDGTTFSVMSRPFRLRLTVFFQTKWRLAWRSIMRSFSDLLIRKCHQRGAHAMGEEKVVRLHGGRRDGEDRKGSWKEEA